jgi:hypothetical protein
MRKIIIAAALVVALTAGAAVSLPLAEKYFADNMKAQIDRDGFFTVSSVDVGLLDRRIAFNDLRSKQFDGMTAKRWEASGLAWPLGELLKGSTPLSGLRLGDPLGARKVEVDGLQLATSDGQTWRFGKVLLEGLDLERFDAVVPPGPTQGSVLTARLMQALSVRHFEERDVVYTIPITQNTAGFVSLVGNNLDHGKLGSFELAALEAAGKSAAESGLRLASFKGEGVDARRILAAMSEPSWRPGRPLGRLGLEHVSATGFGGEVFTRYGVSLGSVTLDVTHEGDGVLKSSMKVDGFVMVPPARSLEGLQMRMAMQAMGLKELRLALDCAGREDRIKGELLIERCALSGPELGELAFGAKLVGADARFWQAIDNGNMLAVYGTKAAFAEATLTLADKGLLDHGSRGLAMASGKSPAVARAELAGEIRRYAPPNVLITEDLTKLLETTARFIEQGGTLALQARPDPPLALDKLSALMRPGPDLVSLLGLTATVSK